MKVSLGQANLARFKAPKSVDFVEKGNLPRGGLDKVQKNILRDCA
jgi:non-ribosomal peptide synthetase component E (peptide arylation enzyme)